MEVEDEEGDGRLGVGEMRGCGVQGLEIKEEESVLAN